MRFNIGSLGVTIERIDSCSDVGGAYGANGWTLGILKLHSRAAARRWVERWKAWESRPQICAVGWCEERAEEDSDYCHIHNQPAWR